MSIHGLERRKLKKELSDWRLFVKMFWNYEDIDRVYGGGNSDEECEKILDKTNARIKELEQILSE